MNSYLINYIKRDEWLSNGINYGAYLRSIEEMIDKGMFHKRAKKFTKQSLWKLIKAYGN